MGPRAGIIFYRRNAKNIDVETKINMAVFPGLQGGPHNHAIAGIATAMKQAATPEFKLYQEQVVANAKAVAAGLMNLGYVIITGGTDCHIIHVDLKKSLGALSGGKGEFILEEVGISCNKNTVPGDQSALNPSGVRFGTPALTTRGMTSEHMETVVSLIHSAFQLGVEIQTSSGPKLVDFKKACHQDDWSGKINSLKLGVEKFAVKFML